MSKSISKRATTASTPGLPEQVLTAVNAAADKQAENIVKPAHVEGYGHAEWVLLDYFDFVVHVFGKETRTFYGLERLWGSATAVDVSSVLAPPARKI